MNVPSHGTADNIVADDPDTSIRRSPALPAEDEARVEAPRGRPTALDYLSALPGVMTAAAAVIVAMGTVMALFLK